MFVIRTSYHTTVFQTNLIISKLFKCREEVMRKQFTLGSRFKQEKNIKILFSNLFGHIKIRLFSWLINIRSNIYFKNMVVTQK